MSDELKTKLVKAMLDYLYANCCADEKITGTYEFNGQLIFEDGFVTMYGPGFEKYTPESEEE